MPSKARGRYVPIDVEFLENHRILAAREQATYLYLAMLLRTKRLDTDGILTTLQIQRLQVPGWKVRLARLIDTGLVEVIDPDTYSIVGFLERNPSAAELADYRRKDANRKRTSLRPDSARNPSGVRTDSVPEEEKEEEKEVEVEPGTLRSVPGGRR